jgi:hypothetical protein
MESGETPYGNGVWSKNTAGVTSKFTSAVSH